MGAARRSVSAVEPYLFVAQSAENRSSGRVYRMYIAEDITILCNRRFLLIPAFLRPLRKKQQRIR